MRTNGKKLLAFLLGFLAINALILLLPFRKTALFIVVWAVLAVACLSAGIVMLFKGAAKGKKAGTSDRQIAARTADMKSLRDKAQALCASIQNPGNAKALKELADELRYSDPVSGAATASYEKRIDTLLESIAHHDDAAERSELIRRATALVRERASAAKTNKSLNS